MMVKYLEFSNMIACYYAKIVSKMVIFCTWLNGCYLVNHSAFGVIDAVCKPNGRNAIWFGVPKSRSMRKQVECSSAKKQKKIKNSAKEACWSVDEFIFVSNESTVLWRGSTQNCRLTNEFHRRVSSSSASQPASQSATHVSPAIETLSLMPRMASDHSMPCAPFHRHHGKVVECWFSVIASSSFRH